MAVVAPVLQQVVVEQPVHRDSLPEFEGVASVAERSP
jgi:hypothetical protein